MVAYEVISAAVVYAFKTALSGIGWISESSNSAATETGPKSAITYGNTFPFSAGKIIMDLSKRRTEDCELIPG